MPKKPLTQEDKIFHFNFPNGSDPIVSQKTQNGILVAIRDLETMFAGAGLVPMVIEVTPLPPRHATYLKNKSYFEQYKNLFRKAYAQAYPMPGMTETTIKIAQKTGEMPPHYPYTCHHLVPLRWGGQNHVENMIFLKDDIHKAIHKITDSYNGFLAREIFKKNNKSRIFLVFPMPPTFRGSELRIMHQNKALSVFEWKQKQDIVESVKACRPSKETQKQLTTSLNSDDLFFMTYFRDNYAKIVIPGKIYSEHATTHQLSAKDIRPIWDKELTAEEASVFLKSLRVSQEEHSNLFSKEQWDSLRKGEIPQGFSVIHTVPFDSSKQKNKRFSLISNEAKDILRRILWEPIWKQLQSLKKTVGNIDIMRYRWPEVFTTQHAQVLIENNQNETKLKKTRYQLGTSRTQTHIRITQNQHGRILHLSDHPFVHQPKVLHTLDASQICSFGVGTPPITETEIIQNLCKRDAFRLKNISRPERLRIEKQKRTPNVLGLEARNLIPKEWGGDDSLDNILFIKKDIYETYHRTVLMPLAQFIIKQKIKGIIQVALPQPLDAYLSKENVETIEPKTISSSARKVAKRRDRRQDKRDLRQEWQYD